VVIGETDGPIAPCGACRQVILELGGNELPVLLTNLKGDIFETTAAAQLPNAFGGRSEEVSDSKIEIRSGWPTRRRSMCRLPWRLLRQKPSAPRRKGLSASAA
jgi:hypothetical protein